MGSKQKSHFFQLKVLPLFIAMLIKFIRLTMRIKYVNADRMFKLLEDKQPFIFTFWHNRLVMMPYGYKGKNVHVLVSQSRDGLMITNTIRHFGIKTVQGSSSRGAVEGLKGIIRIAKKGGDLGFTPDGPRGPACIVKPGVIQAARMTGLPILPVTFGSSRKIVFRSWDKMQLPKLFTRGVFIYGEPIIVPRKLDKKRIDLYSIKLKDSLNKISDEADNYFKS
jgi:hypothetical protein